MYQKNKVFFIPVALLIWQRKQGLSSARSNQAQWLQKVRMEIANTPVHL